jgi:hypothetical protein
MMKRGGFPVGLRGKETLDIAKGLERYGGNEKVYIKILRSYAGSVRSLLKGIEAVGEGGLAAYKVNVHGIKGASYDISADLIGKKAQRLEEASDAGDFEFIQKHNPAFIKAAEEFIDGIESMLSAIDAETPKPKKDRPGSEPLAKLLDACEAYNMTKAVEAMDEIDKYQYEADGGLADWLRENVDVTNFKEIAERLGGL